MPPRIFRFGVHRLDPAARELYRDGKLVPLSPMLFDCLAWLFEHRERAVGRDELGATVWGRVDITDAQIDQLIRKVRRAVGDTGTDQEIIRTIPRFGYRWVAEVEAETPQPHSVAQMQPSARATLASAPQELAESTEDGDAITTSSPAQRDWRRPTLLAGGVSALLLTVLAMLVHLHDGHPHAANEVADGGTGFSIDATPQQTNHVAVLPVVMDDDLDSEWSWLRLGLMDLIATRLREGGMTVVPANNILALRQEGDSTQLNPAAVQAATGARLIIAPTVHKTSSGWRLHLHLHGAEEVAHEVQTHADDAVASARGAADRLLVMFGKPRLGNDDTVRMDAQTSLYRIDAAIDSGDYESARKIMDATPPMLRDDGSLRLRRAKIERASGQHAAARDLFQSVLDSHELTPLPPLVRAEALNGMAVILIEEGRIADGKSYLDDAIGLARHENLPLLYGDAMASRAALHAAEGHHAEADSDFAQARIALELAGDTLGLAELEANQAATLAHRHRYAEAHSLLDKAITRMQRFPPGETLVVALGNRIFLHLAMQEPRAALALAEQAMELVQRVENLRKRQTFLLHTARALIANGRLDQAQRLLDELAADVDPAERPQLEAGMLGNQALLAFSRSRWVDAAELAGRQLEVLSTPTLAASLYARTHSVAWLLRIRALRELGALAEAADEVERFSAWAQSQSDPAVTANASLALAERAAREHHAEAAIKAFESALATASHGAAPADIARVAVSYGSYLISISDLESATRIVGQIAHWAAQDFDCALLQVRLYHALGQHKAWQRTLATARALAGERRIPTELTTSPLTGPAGSSGFIDSP